MSPTVGRTIIETSTAVQNSEFYCSQDNHYCLSNMTQYVLISLKCQNSEHSKKYQISRRVEQINKWEIYNRLVFYMGPEHFISLGLQLATDQVCSENGLSCHISI